MVIQRIQTLFLLIAVVLMVVFYFIPFGFWEVSDANVTFPVNPLSATDQIAVLIPLTVAVVLAFVSIFLFRKMSVQKSMVILSIISVLAAVGVIVYLLTDTYVDTVSSVSIKPVWGGGALLLVGALIMLVAAYRGILHDQKLLRSYDRLR